MGIDNDMKKKKKYKYYGSKDSNRFEKKNRKPFFPSLTRIDFEIMNTLSFFVQRSIRTYVIRFQFSESGETFLDKY